MTVKTNTTNAAIRYFLPSGSTPWKWAESGEVLVWRSNGQTIAFRPEIELILRRLDEIQRVPVFSDLILFIAAMRDAEIFELPVGFQKLHLLPAEIRSDMAAKIEIAEIIFSANSSSIDSELGSRIVRLLTLGLGERLGTEANEQVDSEQSQSLIQNRLHIPDIDVEKLKMRLRTGIAEIPDPIDIELPISIRVQGMLKQLEDDKELSGLSSLALNLMAAVTLPRKLKRDEEMPIGGFADIINRGQFDRLLISELANDDDTLMTRLALNEAMYLRRESPPSSETEIRLVLLHPGIRSWGLPRLFELAVALAVMATAPEKSELCVYRASDKQCVPVAIDSQERIVEYLEILEPALHCGRSLPAFCDMLQEVETTIDPLLIFTREEFEDLDFQQALTNSNLDSALLAIVTRVGDFELIQWSKSGSATIRKSQLSLDKLFSEPEPTHDLIDKDADRSLPAIFAQTALYPNGFPLRLPHTVKNKICRFEADSEPKLLAVAKDRRLMIWSQGEGAYQVTDALPKGNCVAITRDPFEQKIYLMFESHRNYKLVIYDEVQWQADQIDIVGEVAGMRDLIAHRDMVAVVTSRFVINLDLETGKTTDQWLIPNHTRRCNSRFFIDAKGDCFVIKLSGGKFSLVSLHIPQHLNPGHISKVIESPDSESIFGIKSNGDVIDTANAKLIKTGQNTNRIHEITTSKDSTRGFFRLQEGGTLFEIDDQRIKQESGRGRFGPEQKEIACERTLRKKFRSVAVHGDHILLKSNSKQVLTFHLRGNALLFTGTQEFDLYSGFTFTSFEDVELKQKYNLSKAEFDDGSQVFLDSRGLLHLKSANTELAEVSIVLNHGQSSGWIHRKGVWGNKYFVGSDRDLLSAITVYKEFILPFCKQVHDSV